ncbi:hypothetical protein EJ08DRAFT_725006, partial [Tothia fuscella]
QYIARISLSIGPSARAGRYSLARKTAKTPPLPSRPALPTSYVKLIAPPSLPTWKTARTKG